MMLQAVEIIRQGWTHFEKYPRRCWISLSCLLGVLGFLAFLWRLGAIGLVDETEPLFAEAARQMLITGDWVTPYFNESTRFDKPPLIYWLMAIAYRILGVNEWAVRLPSALSALGLMALMFVTLQRFGAMPELQLIANNTANKKANESGISSAPTHSFQQRRRWLTAGLGSAMFAGNLEVILWARQGVSDMLLCGCIGATMLCFFWGYVTADRPSVSARLLRLWTPGNAWYGACFVFCALGILTKGPIAVVLPGLGIGLFLLWIGRFWTVLREIGLLAGMGIMAVLTLPWFVAIIQRHGDAYIGTFFGYHNFERFTEVVNSHSAPWYFYFLVLLLGFFPWSIYLPLAIAQLRFWQRKTWQAVPRSQQLGIFALCWGLSVFGFFSMAVTKLPSYILPMMPATAILVGLLASETLSVPLRQLSTEAQSCSIPGSKKGWLISAAVNLALVTLLAIALGISPRLLSGDTAMPDFSELLRRSGLPWSGALLWLLAGLGIMWCMRYRHRLRWLFVINLVAFFGFVTIWLLPVLGLLDQSRQLPLRQMAIELVQRQQPQEAIVMIGLPKPSLVFYSHQPMQFFQIHKVMREPEVVSERFAIWLEENQPDVSSLLIVSRSPHLERIEFPAQSFELLTTHGQFQLIRLPKAALLGRLQQLAEEE